MRDEDNASGETPLRREPWLCKFLLVFVVSYICKDAVREEG